MEISESAPRPGSCSMGFPRPNMFGPHKPTEGKSHVYISTFTSFFPTFSGCIYCPVALFDGHKMIINGHSKAPTVASWAQDATLPLT